LPRYVHRQYRHRRSRSLDRLALGSPVTSAGAIIALAIAVACGPLSAKEHRSREVTREFQREHPVLQRGSQAALVLVTARDHVLPLACGGPDAVSNMQWQTVAAAKAKDRWEVRACGR